MKLLASSPREYYKYFVGQSRLDFAVWEVKLTSKDWLLSHMEAPHMSQNFCQFLLLVTRGIFTNHSFPVLSDMFIGIGIQILLWLGNCKVSTTGKKVNCLNKFMAWSIILL